MPILHPNSRAAASSVDVIDPGAALDISLVIMLFILAPLVRLGSSAAPSSVDPSVTSLWRERTAAHSFDATLNPRPNLHAAASLAD